MNASTCCLPIEIIERLIAFDPITWRVCNRECWILADRYIFHDPSFRVDRDDNMPLILACEVGYIDIVRHLLSHPRVNPSAQNNLPLRIAHENEFGDIILVLLSSTRITKLDTKLTNLLMLCCVRMNRLDIMKLVVENHRVSTIYLQNCLDLSVKANKSELVKYILLYPRSAPHRKKNYLLKMALAYGYDEIVTMLLTCSKVRKCNTS